MIKYNQAQLKAVCLALNILIWKVPCAGWDPGKWAGELQNHGIGVLWDAGKGGGKFVPVSKEK